MELSKTSKYLIEQLYLMFLGIFCLVPLSLIYIHILMNSNKRFWKKIQKKNWKYLLSKNVDLIYDMSIKFDITVTLI